MEANSNSTSRKSCNKEHDPAERQVVGYAMYYFGYSTWHGKMVSLEDVYLSPGHTGKGVNHREGEVMRQLGKRGQEASLMMQINQFSNEIGL